jgi:hypothetical protein
MGNGREIDCQIIVIIQITRIDSQGGFQTHRIDGKQEVQLLVHQIFEAWGAWRAETGEGENDGRIKV